MNARVVAVVLRGQVSAMLVAMPALVAVARASGAPVRLAYCAPIPPPRVDRHDRVVVNTDTEMARVAARMRDTLTAAVRRFDDVRADVVVRFGEPREEIVTEAEVFDATMLAFVAPQSDGLVARLRARRVRRWAARRSHLQSLVLTTPKRVVSSAPRRRAALDAAEGRAL